MTEIVVLLNGNWFPVVDSPESVAAVESAAKGCCEFISGDGFLVKSSAIIGYYRREQTAQIDREKMNEAMSAVIRQADSGDEWKG